MAPTRKMSWYTPVPARRAQRRRITSGTWANAVRGRGARLDNMLTPTPAVSPSPSLCDTTDGPMHRCGYCSRHIHLQDLQPPE